MLRKLRRLHQLWSNIENADNKCCPWPDLDHCLGNRREEPMALRKRFAYLVNPDHNPGPGSQNTTKLRFVLLDSAVTENTCSGSDVAGCTT
jgi:hypothetical protein